MGENTKLSVAIKIDSEVQHVRQRSSWDCGVVCCLMLINYFNISGPVYEELLEAVGTQSVWTIDLFFLLLEHAVPSVLFTITMGIDPSFKRESYYKYELAKDEVRVPYLFSQAAKQGLPVAQKSLSEADFDFMLQKGLMAVVLVDKRFLICNECNGFASRAFRALRSSFVGHFVIVLEKTFMDVSETKQTNGAPSREHCYIYIDPDSSKPRCRVASPLFHRARTAHGTDQDILFVDRQKQLLDVDILLAKPVIS